MDLFWLNWLHVSHLKANLRYLLATEWESDIISTLTVAFDSKRVTKEMNYDGLNAKASQDHPLIYCLRQLDLCLKYRHSIYLLPAKLKKCCGNFLLKGFISVSCRSCHSPIHCLKFFYFFQSSCLKLLLQNQKHMGLTAHWGNSG